MGQKLKLWPFLVLMMIQLTIGITNKVGTVDSRIVGGRRARAADYPWLANLRRKRNLSVFCGGALLSKRSACLHSTEISNPYF